MGGGDTLQLPLQREESPEREAGKGPSLTRQGALAYSRVWLRRRGQKDPKQVRCPEFLVLKTFSPPPLPRTLNHGRGYGARFTLSPELPGKRSLRAASFLAPTRKSAKHASPSPGNAPIETLQTAGRRRQLRPQGGRHRQPPLQKAPGEDGPCSPAPRKPPPQRPHPPGPPTRPCRGDSPPPRGFF